MKNYCKVCKGDAKQKCSGCQSVFYCSRNCQVADWKNGHKNECKSYEVSRVRKLDVREEEKKFLLLSFDFIKMDM